MSKRLADLERSNLYLFNLLFRHQVYLEGVKVGMNAYFGRMIAELYGEFAKYLAMTRYNSLDAFTRIELEHFIVRFQSAQQRLYSQYTQQFIELLKQFVAADVDVTTAIYSAVTQHPVSKPSAVIPETKSTSSPTVDSIWSTANNELIPASGQTIREMLTNFGATSLTRVTQQIKIGYANDQTTQEVLTTVGGSRDTRFRDGVLAVLAAQSGSIVATILQHVSSIAQAAIAAEFYQQYQWVSIMDSRTTLICRSRNGNIYTYGEGPLPPAHWNCRSKAVSLTQGEELHDIPNTFFDWAIDQPDEFLTDALSAAIAAKLVTKDSRAKDISINNAAKPLTISQFKNKINLITL